MRWLRRFLTWLGILKRETWFPLDWGVPDPQAFLRDLFPALTGHFQRPSAPVDRPYRRLRPRFKGRPTCRYRRQGKRYGVPIWADGICGTTHIAGIMFP